MISPVVNSWYVETETVDLIFSTLPVNWEYVLSKEYSSLLLPFVIKNTSEELRVVLIPIVFLFLLVTYTACGKLNKDPDDEVEIAIGVPPLLANTTLWLFTNGWFSM